MKALLRAVRFALVSDAAIMAANSGGVFTGRGQDDAAMPYLLVTSVGGFMPVYYTARNRQLEHITVRFQAWSKSIDTAMTTVERIEKIFRTANVALESGTVVCTSKSSDGIEIDSDPTDDGHDVYMGIIDLDFTVQRNPIS